MTTRASSRSDRGSVLLTALIIAFVIALALTSYLKMTSTAASTAQRSFLENDAMNVTEGALEQALWTFNQATSSTGVTTDSVWTGANWTVYNSASPKYAIRTFGTSFFPLSQNATAQSKVYVQYYDSTGDPPPVAVAKTIVTPSYGSPFIKMIKIQMKRNSYFSSGLVAKNSVTFNGNNATVDAWNSNPTNVSSPTASNGTLVPYSTSVRDANGSVATISVTAGVSVQNANIYGYVSVGSSSSSAVSVGSQGIVSGNFSATGGTIDTSRISTNFTDNLPDASLPSGVTPTPYMNGSNHNTITGSTSLPLTSDINGNKAVMINGVPTYYYSVQQIDMTGNASNLLTIKSGYNVAIDVTAGSGTTAVATTGSAGITIQSGATLSIYTAGDVNVTGDSSGNGGVTNSNGQASGFQIWGTNTSPNTQKIGVSGNGSLSAVIYAPEAAVTIAGNGEVYGAVVGYSDTISGNANFHYDESLGNFGGSNPFKISSWQELVSKSDRDVYSSQLNGGNSSF